MSKPINWGYWRRKFCLCIGCLVRPVVNRDPPPGPPWPFTRDYACVVCGDKFERKFQQEMG